MHADMPHLPVLYNIILDELQLRPAGRYIDCTVGAGGHSHGILQQTAPDGQLLALDRDPHALALARERLAEFGKRATLVQASYTTLDGQALALGWTQVDGILLDLGLSSMQLNQPERGFSFRQAGPLDMRFDPQAELTAADIVNHWGEKELADVIYRLGEERYSRRIARAIVARRPIDNTLALASLIAGVVKQRSKRIHPATRTFQALRMAVNDELGNIETVLPKAIDLLASGGRLAVIAFHSLEDRIVKTVFKQESQDCICPPEQPVCTCEHSAQIRRVTRKPIRPDEAETANNPRSRSARLRVAEKI